MQVEGDPAMSHGTCDSAVAGTCASTMLLFTVRQESRDDFQEAPRTESA